MTPGPLDTPAAGGAGRPSVGSERLLAVGLLALCFLPFAGALIPGSLGWGVNHLRYLSPAFVVGWGLVALTLVLPPCQQRIRQLLSGPIPRLLFRGFLGPAGFVLGGGILFALLRERSFFMGDGYLVGELADRGVRFRAFDSLDYLLHFQVWKAIKLWRPVDSFTFYQGASVAAGALGLALVPALVRKLSFEPWRKALFLCLFFFSGSIALFFGYVESYCYLFVLLTAFLVLGVASLEGRAPLWAPSTCFGLGLAFHLTAPASGLALLYLAHFGPVPSPRRRWLEVAGPPLILFLAAVSLHFACGYNLSLFRKEFVEATNTKSILIPLAGYRGLFSLYHAKDLLNLALLISPVALWIGLTRLGWILARIRDRRIRFLLAQMAGVLLAALLVDRKLGGARDWDLLAAHVSGLLLLAALAMPEDRPADQPVRSAKLDRGSARGGRARTAPAPASAAMAVTAAFLLAGPWVVLLNREARSVRRFVEVAGDFPDFARAYAYEDVGKYYRTARDYARAEEMFERCVQVNDQNPRLLFLLGWVYFREEKLDEAERTYRRGLEINPKHLVGMEMLGKVLSKKAMVMKPGPEQSATYKEAAACFERLTEAKPESADYWEALGYLALQSKQLELSARAYQRAEELNRRLKARQGL